MEFSSRARLKHARLAGDRREQYPHSLQFYLEPPMESISLVEFESFAVDRLKLLKVIENLGVSHVRGNDVYKSKLEAELRKLKFPYRILQCFVIDITDALELHTTKERDFGLN
ncbi:hypothetical protein TURU_000325 [Turdus rufiventris]|nr:hypothetical protein TURU_000325 [Turdus rufiventris]